MGEGKDVERGGKTDCVPHPVGPLILHRGFPTHGRFCITASILYDKLTQALRKPAERLWGRVGLQVSLPSLERSWGLLA